jgi:Spy/CpxP family protein refolding chaperone
MLTLRGLVLAAGLLLVVAPVLAQTNEPEKGQGMMGQGGQGMMGHGDQGMMGQKNLKAMVEGRLAYVKTALEITDAEATVWKAFEDASRANVQGMQAAHQAMMTLMQSGTAVDRMQAHITMMQSRLDALKALQPATEALYKALTPEQQKQADTLLGMGGGMGGGMK